MNRAYYRGGGLFAYNCSPILVNNTVVRNRSTASGYYSRGAGIHAYSTATVAGENNIVYDNFATNAPNVYGSVSFTYSCVQGGMSGMGNISSDPLFVHNPPLGFFYLSQTEAGQPQNSPCVNAGDPASPMIIGTTRTDQFPDIEVVDMGFHWWLTVWSSDLVSQMEYELWVESGRNSEAAHDRIDGRTEMPIEIVPNPFNPITAISYQLSDVSLVILEVYDVSGRKVTELANGWQNAGTHEVTFNGSDLASGIYVYRLEAGQFASSGKMILMK